MRSMREEIISLELMLPTGKFNNEITRPGCESSTALKLWSRGTNEASSSEQLPFIDEAKRKLDYSDEEVSDVKMIGWEQHYRFFFGFC